MKPQNKTQLRDINEQNVLTRIMREPGIPRHEIAKAAGLSPAAVTGIVNRLLKAGLIRETGTESRGALGRRPTALWIVPDSRLFVGVEIATREAAVALAGLDGVILERQIIPFDADAGRYLGSIRNAVAQLADSHPNMVAMGVSIPGTLDPKTGRLAASTHLHWHDMDLMQALTRDLHLPAIWDNNSNLAAVAERWFRDSRESPLNDFVFVTLRVGLGTGLIANGTLIRGARLHAGEFGHMTLYPGGTPCECGRLGCWEEYAGDRALVREYGAGDSLTSVEIARRALEGEPRALAAVETVAQGLGEGLASIVLALNPAAIAVDDYAAAAWPIVEPVVNRILRQLPSHWVDGLSVFPSSRTPLEGAIAGALSHYFAGGFGSVTAVGSASRSLQVV